MAIEKLPAEILSEILGYLERYDIDECLEVNKKWNEATVPLFYKKMEINGL